MRTSILKNFASLNLNCPYLFRIFHLVLSREYTRSLLAFRTGDNCIELEL